MFYTLYGHLSMGVLSELSVGDCITAGQRVAKIGAPPVNGGWAPHVHFQVANRLLFTPI